MTLATGKAGMTLIELTMVGFLIGLITLIAWPAAARYADQSLFTTEARRLDAALRTSRETAVRNGQTVTFDSAPFCRRLIPKPTTVRFFADGTCDGFSARPDVPFPIAVMVDESGRIWISHDAA